MLKRDKIVLCHKVSREGEGNSGQRQGIKQIWSHFSVYNFLYGTFGSVVGPIGAKVKFDRCEEEEDSFQKEAITEAPLLVFLKEGGGFVLDMLI